MVVSSTRSASCSIRTLLEACGAGRSLVPVAAPPPQLDRRQLLKMRGNGGSTGGEQFEDWTLRGLNELLAALPSLELDERGPRTALLWEALIEVQERRGAGAFSGTYKWRYHSLRSASFDAAFVEKLKSTEWVPGRKGELERPEFVLFGQLGWKENAFLQSRIPFRPPIIETLAREAGIDPGVLDVLKKHGITSEAELLARLGVVQPSRSLQLKDPPGELPSRTDREATEPKKTADLTGAGESSATSTGSDPAVSAEPEAQASTDPSHAREGDARSGGQPRSSSADRGSRPQEGGGHLAQFESHGPESQGTGGEGHGARSDGGSSPDGATDRGSRPNGPDGDAGRSDFESNGVRSRGQGPADGGVRPFVSYLAAHPDDHEPDAEGLDQETRMALEESAIALILKTEPHLQRTSTNNPGFDLYEGGPGDDPRRWIEVKAMRGELRDRPVGLSRAQFECALMRGEAYWLYVVEHAGEEGSSRILRIQDPAGKARTFTFDEGWIAVAEVADVPLKRSA